DFCTGSQRLSTAEVDPDNFADGHETHVAGYATGARSGVAKGAHIFSLRTTWHDENDRTNGGPACVNGGQNGAVAAAFTWIKDHGRHPGVINFSGGHGTSDIQSAIQKAITANFVVTLSGNIGGDVTSNWGRDVPEVALVVGGTDINDRALNATGDYGAALALYAPAKALIGAGKASNTDYSDPGIYGDSWAAPFVAGVAATYLQRHPQASPAIVRAATFHRAAGGRVTNPGTSPNRLLQAFDSF